MSSLESRTRQEKIYNDIIDMYDELEQCPAIKKFGRGSWEPKNFADEKESSGQPQIDILKL